MDVANYDQEVQEEAKSKFLINLSPKLKKVSLLDSGIKNNSPSKLSKKRRSSESARSKVNLQMQPINPP